MRISDKWLFHQRLRIHKVFVFSHRTMVITFFAIIKTVLLILQEVQFQVIHGLHPQKKKKPSPNNPTKVPVKLAKIRKSKRKRRSEASRNKK